MGEAITPKEYVVETSKQLYFPYSSRKTNKRARWPFFKVAVGANQAYNNIPSFTNGHTPLRPMTKTAMIQAPVEKSRRVRLDAIWGNSTYRKHGKSENHLNSIPQTLRLQGRTVSFQQGKFMQILYINKQVILAPLQSSSCSNIFNCSTQRPGST